MLGFVKSMKFSCFLLTLVVALTHQVTYAFSSVAVVPKHSTESVYAAWNYPSQKEADSVALEGCRAEARGSGIGKLAMQCRIVLRQKDVGAGAIVCGENGCAYVSGHPSKEAAIAAAFAECSKHFKTCQETNITAWWDEAGYRVRQVKAPTTKEACGPPPGKVVRSTYQCNNGDCIRTFENGCQVRFQAPYCRDPFNGRWEWKPDGC